MKITKTTMSRERDTLIWLMGVLDSIEDGDTLTGPTPSGNEDPYIKIPRKTFDRIRTRVIQDLKQETSNKEILRG